MRQIFSRFIAEGFVPFHSALCASVFVAAVETQFSGHDRIKCSECALIEALSPELNRRRVRCKPFSSVIAGFSSLAKSLADPYVGMNPGNGANQVSRGGRISDAYDSRSC